MNLTTARWLGVLSAILSAGVAQALPNRMNVQGRLVNAAGTAVDGTYALKFTIYDAPSGGVTLWSEVQATVAVSAGAFDAVLGDTANNSVPASVFLATTQPWLGITVLAGSGIGAGGEPELPRRPFATTAYAFVSASAAESDLAKNALSAVVAKDVQCAGCVGPTELGFDPVTQAEQDSAIAGLGTTLGMLSCGQGQFPKMDAGKWGCASLSPSASDLQCTSCVSTGELDFDVATQAELNAVKSSIPTSVDGLGGGTIVGAVNVGGAVTQSGSPVCDKSGSCGAELFTLSCAKDQSPVYDGKAWACGNAAGVITQEMMPANGLNEVSNNLVTNQFIDKVTHSYDATIPAYTAPDTYNPLAIRDQNPTGTTDTIDFPDIGTAEKLTVSVNLTNSDLKTVKVTLTDPKFVEYVLYDKGGTPDNKNLTASYPDPTSTVSGNLLTWVGQNPKGKWVLKVVDSGFLNNKNDGQINAWNVGIQTLSNKKVEVLGKLIVDGQIAALSDLAVTGTLTVGGMATFSSGIDLGSGANDDLTAQDIAILTAGPQSDGDSLHTHAGENQKLTTILDNLNAMREELTPTSCPTDMALGGKAGTESAFCIEKTERGGATYRDAVTTCAQAGRHVCTLNQWWIGSQLGGMSNMCYGNWEWVGDRDEAYTSGHLQTVAGGNGGDCIITSWAWSGQHANGNGNNAYRCCRGGVSSQFD